MPASRLTRENSLPRGRLCFYPLLHRTEDGPEYRPVLRRHWRVLCSSGRESGSTFPFQHREFRRLTTPIRVMHLVFTLGPGGMEHGVVKIVNGLDAPYVVSSICSTTPADPDMAAQVRTGV